MDFDFLCHFTVVVYIFEFIPFHTSPFCFRTILSKQDECNVSFDMSTINVIVVRGLVILAISLVAAFLIDLIGKTTVICLFWIFPFFMSLFHNNIILGAWFTLGTIGAFGLLWANNYYANMAMMTVLLSTVPLGHCFVAISSDLFETKYK